MSKLGANISPAIILCCNFLKDNLWTTGMVEKPTPSKRYTSDYHGLYLLEVIELFLFPLEARLFSWSFLLNDYLALCLLMSDWNLFHLVEVFVTNWINGLQREFSNLSVTKSPWKLEKFGNNWFIYSNFAQMVAIELQKIRWSRKPLNLFAFILFASDVIDDEMWTVWYFCTD